MKNNLEIEEFKITGNLIEVYYFYNGDNKGDCKCASFSATDESVLNLFDGHDNYNDWKDDYYNGMIMDIFKEHATDYYIEELMKEIYFPSLKKV